MLQSRFFFPYKLVHFKCFCPYVGPYCLSCLIIDFTHHSLTNLLDDMGTRIDDLEKNIADLMTQAGVNDGGL